METWTTYKNQKISYSNATQITHIDGPSPSNVHPFISQIYGAKKTRDKDDLQEYLDEDTEDQDVCVLSYWRDKRSKWPNLCRMAQDYLAPTASSASSEREFSSGRDMLGLNRHSMSPQMMQACLCLRSWIRGGFSNLSTSNENDCSVGSVQQVPTSPSPIVRNASVSSVSSNKSILSDHERDLREEENNIVEFVEME